MKQNASLLLAAIALLPGLASATAQELGYWRAASKTAHSVTGDVQITNDKLMINFALFNIAHARDLQPAEVAAIFDADSAGTEKAGLYGMNIPAAKKFLHKNTLCGTEDTHWMVAYADGNSLQLAFFSSEKVPTFTVDAISNSSSLCGTYSYTR